MKTIAMILAQTLLLSAAPAFAAAPTEWHAVCRVANLPEKEIRVKQGESVVVAQNDDYDYSVELRYGALTLRADAVKDSPDHRDLVNYAYVQYKNELPTSMILTSHIANVFVCTEKQ